ncbi:hypothetical protein Anapl_00144 [Anas platyrhynchos]|uniref:Uncharacterized protein n=1 Tax=Anas platyrhynchos TaxID=8839 RepID=R0LES2_ANAPL|nr:hypothetical protein Anapl_00144 [Anas platyrhynchos]
MPQLVGYRNFYWPVTVAKGKRFQTEVNAATRERNKKERGGKTNKKKNSNSCNLLVTCEAQFPSASSYLLRTDLGEAAAAGQLSAAASGSASISDAKRGKTLASASRNAVTYTDTGRKETRPRTGST